MTDRVIIKRERLPYCHGPYFDGCPHCVLTSVDREAVLRCGKMNDRLIAIYEGQAPNINIPDWCPLDAWE